jgi:ferredoxin-NADP reductase
MGLVEGEATLIGWREVGPGVRHFVFEAPAPLEFLPGQFVSFSGEIGGRKVTRAYSFAAPPAGERFELCLNRVEGGPFSSYLFTLEAGARVPMKAPYGAFTWREPASDSLLIATGTGIAPFLAMLPPRLAKDTVNRYTLLFGARHFLYREELERLARGHENFRLLPTLTRPPAGWTGLTGHVQAHLADLAGSRRDWIVYLCGLKAMVDDVRRILKEWGFDRRQIVYEKYD